MQTCDDIFSAALMKCAQCETFQERDHFIKLFFPISKCFLQALEQMDTIPLWKSKELKKRGLTRNRGQTRENNPTVTISTLNKVQQLHLRVSPSTSWVLMEMNGRRQQTDVLEQEIKHHECRTKRLRLLAELQVWGNEDLLKDGLISSEPGVLQMIIVPPLCWRLRVLNASPGCPRWAGRKQRVSLFHVKLKRRMRSYTHCSYKTKASCWRRPQLLRQPWMAALRFETNRLKECSAGCSFWVMWPRMAGARPRTKAYITSAMGGGVYK